MSSQYFVCIFLCVYMLQFTYCVHLRQSSKSGPFKASIISIQDCSSPTKPYVKNPPAIFQSTTHNNTISGSITILRDTKNMKIRLRCSIQRNGEWEIAYVINNLNCHGMVMRLVWVSVNIKYDRKNCLLFKGTYSFDNMEVNPLLHLWFSKAQYGHSRWQAETYTQSGTITCKEFEGMIEPA